MRFSSSGPANGCGVVTGCPSYVKPFCDLLIADGQLNVLIPAAVVAIAGCDRLPPTDDESILLLYCKDAECCAGWGVGCLTLMARLSEASRAA